MNKSTLNDLNYAKNSFSIDISTQENKIKINYNDCSLLVATTCPGFVVDGVAYGSDLGPFQIIGDLNIDNNITLKYHPITIKDTGKLTVEIFVQWYADEGVLRKWAQYYFNDVTDNSVLEEIILENLDTTDNLLIEFNPTTTQSHPVFIEGFFAGIEYPVASTRKIDNEILLAHRPGKFIKNGELYQSKKAVYGIAHKGKEKDTFKEYIASHGIQAEGFHINYNSWWTAPLPYTQDDILQLMREYKEKLYSVHGETFDTFCIDLGWSDPHSIWKINEELFPEGFDKLKELVESMGSKLGLWISPSNCYHPHAIDNDWAKTQGYEISTVPWTNDTKHTVACLGGEKYLKGFGESLTEVVQKYDIRQLKLDGCILECPETDHGHQPNALSTETIAEGLIDVFIKLRALIPDIWMETTCFRWNPSPWWFFYVNSIIGTYGDDAPHGRVPCPTYRESYTSARDYFNIQGTYHLPIPVKYQEVLGIIHQTSDCFMNDAVMTILRGHMFLPLYANPAMLDATGWKKLAHLFAWARKNASIMSETQVILPQAWENEKVPLFSNDEIMPRQPYGYSHWNGNKGLLVIRNPWISPIQYELQLAECSTFDAAQNVNIVSIYPEVRVYGYQKKLGSMVTIPLAPYETVVLEIGTDINTENIIGVEEALTKCISVMDNKADVNVSKEEGMIQVDMNTDFVITAPHAEVLILIESKNVIPTPINNIEVDGMEAKAEILGTEGAWVHSSIDGKENWMFLSVPVSNGKHNLQVKLETDISIDSVSAWVWVKKPTSDKECNYKNTLPPPKYLSVDAAMLFEKTTFKVK